MIESYYIGTYWASRKKSVQETAGQLVDFLEIVRVLDPFFGKWYRPCWSFEKAIRQPIQIDVTELIGLITAEYPKGKAFTSGNATDPPHMRIRVWTGGREQAASVSVSNGILTTNNVVNSCVFEFPYEGPDADRMLKTGVLAPIMANMSRIFDPDWSTVVSQIYQNRVGTPERHRPLVGWLTYLSARRGKIPALPPPARVVPVPEFGSIIVATADSIKQVLDKNGLLAPLESI